MEWVRQLFHPKIRRKQTMSIQVLSEHRTAEHYRVTQGSADDVLYDVWLRVVVEPSGQGWYEIWVLLSEPRPAPGHKAVALTWRGRMNGRKLPPVVSQELEGIGLHEVITDVTWLFDSINANN